MTKTDSKGNLATGREALEEAKNINGAIDVVEHNGNIINTEVLIFENENHRNYRFLNQQMGQLTGIIKDAETNSAISGAQITAVSSDNETGVAFTNANGEFLMKLCPGTYELVISAKGYNSHTIQHVVVHDVYNASIADPILLYPQSGDDGTTNWDFIEPVTHQKTVPAGYTGIYTAEDLNNVRNNLTGNYILMNDIDLSLYANWNPIGTSNSPFKGIFDGNGYVIKNMSVTVTNATNYVGGLFGQIYESIVKNIGMIESNIKAQFTGSGINVCIGGIVGFSSYSSILNCYNTGNINAISTASSHSFSPFARVGGILGGSSFEGSITSCYNTGYISASSTADVVSVGGIVGDSNFSITNCYNIGYASATSSHTANTGGIAGSCLASITNCYNTGHISSSPSISSTCMAYAGGIAGYSGFIANCYNTGTVSVPSYISVYLGGIIGHLPSSGTITNCYYLNNISRGDGNNIGILTNVKALSENEMRNKDNFVDFDFDNVWYIDSNSDYPYPQLRK